MILFKTYINNLFRRKCKLVWNRIENCNFICNLEGALSMAVDQNASGHNWIDLQPIATEHVNRLR